MRAPTLPSRSRPSLLALLLLTTLAIGSALQAGSPPAASPAPAEPPPTSASQAPHLQIGVVDLVTVILVHPRLALFDGERLGFYRLPLGLRPEEWQRRLMALQAEVGSPPATLTAALATLASQAAILEEQRVELLRASDAHPPGRGDHRLASLTATLEALQRQRQDLEFRRDHPDLTSPAETRAILAEIETEVLAIIASVAAELRLAAVLNRSLPLASPPPPTAAPLIGHGADFPTVDLYYAFLASHPASTDPTVTPPSQRLARWLDLTRHPAYPVVREIRPHPMVIQGGQDLTFEVITRLFQKYNLPPDVLSTLLRALSERDPRFLRRGEP
ncbi:MAG: hypothetical protein OZSIB_3084 [Candidatus Ozemobacter sibiricus]|uniref:Uncharacterized protein n=1 Tax=Candidatus Ozemobacter sibiricus TaxID=2268124 RepID=A0A367ZGN9_9BACT|nr:MAG: hypothetical protein OZSIB_3084 [Candidatus Ozemobacter sibiricus]